MKLIAHAITNPTDAQRALNAGVDFIEVDVSERIIFSRFTTRHHGVLGKLGVGRSLEPMLAGFKGKLFLDIKHASYSFTFREKFLKLLKKIGVKAAIICGKDWQIISDICQKSSFSPFYTINRSQDMQKIKELLPKLKPPAGFSVQYRLIDKEFMSWVKKFYTASSVWACIVNNSAEAKRLAKLGVDGIVTDEWKKFGKKWEVGYGNVEIEVRNEKIPQSQFKI